MNVISSLLNFIGNKIGNVAMGTTATTLTGAIAEHESQINDLVNKPSMHWRHVASNDYSVSLGANEATTYTFPDVTMPNISGYTRFAVPRTTSSNVVATGWAFDSSNHPMVYVRNLRSSSSSAMIRLNLFYLNNSLAWSE